MQLLQLLVCPSTSAFKTTQNCLQPSSMPLSARGLFAAMLVKKGCDVSSRDTMPASLIAVSCSTINQSTNQSINQLINQSINQSTFLVFRTHQGRQQAQLIADAELSLWACSASQQAETNCRRDQKRKDHTLRRQFK